MSDAIQLHHYAAGAMQALHEHDRGSISLVVRGELAETCDGITRRVQPGDMILKPAGTVHADVYGPRGASLYTIVVDGDGLAYGTRFGGAATRLFATAIDESRAGSPFSDVVFDLMAALHCDQREPASARMREVARRVSRSDVSVESLAHELQMHPVALARAFRREHGCSMTAFRRRLRARAAAVLLASTDMPLVDVALESGFSDHSHFCRHFKRETGLTPSAFRSLAV